MAHYQEKSLCICMALPFNSSIFILFRAQFLGSLYYIHRKQVVRIKKTAREASGKYLIFKMQISLRSFNLGASLTQRSLIFISSPTIYFWLYVYLNSMHLDQTDENQWFWKCSPAKQMRNALNNVLLGFCFRGICRFTSVHWHLRHFFQRYMENIV